MVTTYTKYTKIGLGSHRQNAMARHIRRECKRAGLPFATGVDYAIRRGFRRQDAVAAAKMAYRMDNVMSDFFS